MKALTLHEPWASLIADWHKTSETRSWAPPHWLITERIAIHAGKNREHLDWFPEFYDDGEDLPLGSIVCTAILSHAFQVYTITTSTDGRDIARSRTGDRHVIIDDYGDYSLGRWIWVLNDIKKVKHHRPIRGKQGLWDVDDDFVGSLF